MKIRTALLASIALLLAACGKPVPAEKSAYVGEWREKNMYLLIRPDGTVRYQRVSDGVTRSINAPIKAFAGDNFVVGIGAASTTFVVTKPPRQDGAAWKMVVDGVELVRSAE